VHANVEQPGLLFKPNLRTMPAAGTFAQSLTLRDDVPSGRYRLAKDVSTEDSGHFTVSFEFEVDRPAGAD
jgi:hypothetical protein